MAHGHSKLQTASTGFGDIIRREINLDLQFFLFFFKTFLTWTIFKVFIEFVTILLLFYVREACGISAPRPGIKPAPPALEGEVLTTGPPETSLDLQFLPYDLDLRKCSESQLLGHFCGTVC